MALIRQSFWAKSLPALGLILAVVLVAILALEYLGASGSGDARTRVDAAVQAGRADVAGALAGDANSIGRLQAIRSELAGYDAAGLVGGARWRALDGALSALVGAGDQIGRFHAQRAGVVESLPDLLVSVGGLMSALPPASLQASGAELARFEARVQVSGSVLRELGRPGADFAASSVQMSDARDYLTTFVQSLSGNGADLDLASVAGAASQDDIAANAARFAGVIDGLGELIAESGRMQELAGLADDYSAAAVALHEAAAPGSVAGAFPGLSRDLAVAACLLMLGILFAYYKARDYRRAAELQAEQTERDQEAILRLLDELANLADGDLTVEATVTEDITGAIADSINYAIDALRNLVTTVNESAILVDAASKQTASTASQLMRSSDLQAKQATAASESVSKMAASVEEISADSERCADVARYAVDIAHKGGEAVRRTIEGMNTIRETIQDTSKRIKRLGESSQEIGNIVELIEEIAEQTNILALNASIEASRAGEASRGFAVVADEVQKLAERSTNATRKIEVLVSTIQSDTNEAVVSMERSTTDVVGGALLAENAGAALEEIEQVSHQIASLVQNISGTAGGQSRVSSAISKNMDVLTQISARNRQATAAASGHIQRLSELASQLRETVRGFRLPDDVTATGILSRAEVERSLRQEAEVNPPLGVDKQRQSG